MIDHRDHLKPTDDYEGGDSTCHYCGGTGENRCAECDRVFCDECAAGILPTIAMHGPYLKNRPQA